MKRRLVLAGIIVAAVVAVSTLAVLLRQPPPGPRGPAADRARRACAGADRFHALVSDDASLSEVRRTLDRAISDAKRAAALDPRWLPLQSGLETFGVALDNDDAGSANVAVRVVRAQCAVFREP